MTYNKEKENNLIRLMDSSLSGFALFIGRELGLSLISFSPIYINNINPRRYDAMST